jgi:hypothetical protein
LTLDASLVSQAISEWASSLSEPWEGTATNLLTVLDGRIDDKMRKLRNHGLAGRDSVVMLGCNSRLDSLQAVVGNWLRIVMVYVVWLPATTSCGFALLSGTRPPTCVLTGGEETGGGDSLLSMVAVFVYVPGPVGRTRTRRKPSPPTTTVPRFHVTVPAKKAPPLVAETNVVPAGRTSLTVGPVVFDGPAFDTPIVYVTLVPGTTTSGPVFVTATSALLTTVEVAVDESFKRFASVIPGAEIVTVLVRVLPAPSAGSSLAMSV